MMCSAHANLCDQYARKAFLLDTLILGISTWLIAVAFVTPTIEVSLIPIDVKPNVWNGMLAVFVFFFTLMGMRLDWRGRSEAHMRSLELYSEIKLEAGSILEIADEPTDATFRSLLARYGLANATGAKIPEKQFLKQKRHHLTKIALSKHLDANPSSSILIARMRLWWKHNAL